MSRARAATRDVNAIERREGVRGGAPIIAGTGVRVIDVAIRYELLGQSPEEIMIALPHLDLSQIHAALSYYYLHKHELDREWKSALQATKRGRDSHPSRLEKKLGQVAAVHR